MAKGPKGKTKPLKPDEAYSGGPVRVARYGKTTVVESNWDPAEFAAMQKRLVADYPNVVAEIDRIVLEIAALVSCLRPGALLREGWWVMARRHLEVETESEIDFEDGINVRMVDYIQSVIAAVRPADEQHDFTEEEYRRLRELVSSLFQKVSHDYQVCATAVAKGQPSYDDSVEEFKFKAQIDWCNVRGHRYQVHEPAYLREMFLPHSDILVELFGITGEEFVREMVRLVEHLATGIKELVGNFASFREDVNRAMKAKLKKLAASARPRESKDSTDDAATDGYPSEGESKAGDEGDESAEGDEGNDSDEGNDGEALDADSDNAERHAIKALLAKLQSEVIRENQWEERGAAVVGAAFGMDFFDLEKCTTLPKGLLESLSWGAGEDTSFFADGPQSGWPLRVWPVFRKPFLRIDGRFYCFDHYSLFDGLYRAMQRTLLSRKPAYKQPWNNTQAAVSERLPFQYLEKILPGSSNMRPVYYPIPKATGAGVNWAELDGLLVYDDALFLVEVKAGAFTQEPPSSNFASYLTSMERLLLDPATQGQRFLAYLRGSDSVPLFDREHRQVRVIRASDFRNVIILTVSLDSLTELAAQVQHLRRIGINVGSEPVWAVSVDDLRVYADVFDSPLIFLHYAEQRMAAFRSDVVEMVDEIDHLGLYLEHNNYSQHAADMKGESEARLTFTGYRDPIDRFFRERMVSPDLPCPLRQRSPRRFNEILDVLARPVRAGAARVASTLLDCGGEWRQQISDWIDVELAKQPSTRRPIPLSTHSRAEAPMGAMPVTIYCWSPIVKRNAAGALEQARTVFLLSEDKERLLLELTYGNQRELLGVEWAWVDRSSIPPDQLPRLLIEADKLREARVRARASEHKIGRNEQCPCGSGSKYKRCCLGRNPA